MFDYPAGREGRADLPQYLVEVVGVEFGFLASGIADETEEMEFLGFVSKNGDTTMATSTVTQAIIMSQG